MWGVNTSTRTKKGRRENKEPADLWMLITNASMPDSAGHGGAIPDLPGVIREHERTSRCPGAYENTDYESNREKPKWLGSIRACSPRLFSCMYASRDHPYPNTNIDHGHLRIRF